MVPDSTSSSLGFGNQKIQISIVRAEISELYKGPGRALVQGKKVNHLLKSGDRVV